MKQQRHKAIRDLLVRTAIGSQGELRNRLANSGFRVTQATLSRDIHELNLSKGPGGYSLPTSQADDHSPGVHDVLRSFGKEVRLAMNLLVVVTSIGGAQTIAAAIDQARWPEVLGTIAGDDTVLIVCPDNQKSELLKARINEHIR